MIQLDVDCRNARLDALEAAIGASPTLKIRSGAVPANVAAARTGTVLATIALPADWMAAAANGTKSMSGTWKDNAADAQGGAGHYEILSSGGTVKLQGTVSITGGGGDMEVNNPALEVGQEFTITAYSWVEQNA